MYQKYYSLEQEKILSEQLSKLAEKSLKKWGSIEKAKIRTVYGEGRTNDDGTMNATVQSDGVYSHRSYGTNYSSISGGNLSC